MQCQMLVLVHQIKDGLQEGKCWEHEYWGEPQFYLSKRGICGREMNVDMARVSSARIVRCSLLKYALDTKQDKIDHVGG